MFHDDNDDNDDDDNDDDDEEEEEEELELDNNEDTKTEDDDDENKEEDTKTEDDDERDEDKERFLKMLLENSNAKFKHEPAYQDKMYKLYLEKKGRGGPDYLPVFKRFITEYANHTTTNKNRLLRELKKKLEEYTDIVTHYVGQQITSSPWDGTMVKFKYYLKVPYNDKEQAKVLGAKWDKNKKKWYYIYPNNNYICLERRWGRLSDNG